MPSAPFAASINADLFRIACHAVSTEETRYYLNGVFVQPHAMGGVVLVTADGHRLLVIHDHDGQANGAAIVRPNKVLAGLCKAKSKEVKRWLVIAGDTTKVEAEFTTGEREQIGSAPTTLIDGTFPDWRRVVPRNGIGEGPTHHFNGAYLAGMAALGGEFPGSSKGSAARVSCTKDGGPALIRWTAAPYAFGLLMPMCGDGDWTAEVPAFIDTVEPKPATAKAA